MRLKLQITGIVQGVGFRPFVYRLAKEMGMKGYVRNNTAGVEVEVEGEKHDLEDFLIRVDKEKPAVSKIYSLQYSFLRETGFEVFEIMKSLEKGDKRAPLQPDLAVCDDCVREIGDPKDRRFMYLFTNCTNCGPRFTIIEDLPYDRKNTSMKKFTMCSECNAEYELPADRRFHAQPNACHVCGPWITLYDIKGNLICSKEDAIEKTLHLLSHGHIIAVKGIGGYHLVCDATNEDAVALLRKRKNREEKPMAVMFRDTSSLNGEVHMNELEKRALTSVERPIVIVRKHDDSTLAGSVSPGNSTVGVYLPYTPLHHIMLRKFKKPLVVTSANMTDEPIVTDERDAFKRLVYIADHILINNRAIVRRCDDSVVRVAAGRQVQVRRSRGYAPVPVRLPFNLQKRVLALGPYMNNTIALGMEDKVYLSQHVGDLDTPLATEFYEETVNDFLRLFGVDPEIVVADMHPGYYSTKFGERHFSDRLVKVQHHYAHILSCMVENEIPEDMEVIGFSFDGAGYGADKTIWGGEVLIASYRGFRRALHLRPFGLPGGDKSVAEPARTALSLLYETFGQSAADIGVSPLTDKEKAFMLEMIGKNINCPETTSMGRLFDGVASIIGLKHKVSYQAQAAIALEQAASTSREQGAYPFVTKNNIIYHLPIIDRIVGDVLEGVPQKSIAKKFHNTVIDMIVYSAELLREETSISTVALSGGVFQNVLLLEGAFNKLKEREFSILINQIVPPNDGGISLGQAIYSRFI